ncbi:ferrochelatase, partial [Brevibacterium paucivorans]
SYSSDRQYREDFAKASQKLAGEGIDVEIDKIRQYYNHPGFANTQVKIVREALAEFAQKTGGLDPQKHRVLYVVPFGFVSDHMEVVYDLDTEAKETADKHGFAFVRAATVGT